jgi:hypothetical protein
VARDSQKRVGCILMGKCPQREGPGGLCETSFEGVFCHQILLSQGGLEEALGNLTERLHSTSVPGALVPSRQSCPLTSEERSRRWCTDTPDSSCRVLRASQATGVAPVCSVSSFPPIPSSLGVTVQCHQLHTQAQGSPPSMCPCEPSLYQPSSCHQVSACAWCFLLALSSEWTKTRR